MTSLKNLVQKIMYVITRSSENHVERKKEYLSTNFTSTN